MQQVNTSLQEASGAGKSPPRGGKAEVELSASVPATGQVSDAARGLSITTDRYDIGFEVDIEVIYMIK